METVNFDSAHLISTQTMERRGRWSSRRQEIKRSRGFNTPELTLICTHLHRLPMDVGRLQIMMSQYSAIYTVYAL